MNEKQPTDVRINALSTVLELAEAAKESGEDAEACRDFGRLVEELMLNEGKKVEIEWPVAALANVLKLAASIMRTKRDLAACRHLAAVIDDIADAEISYEGMSASEFVEFGRQIIEQAGGSPLT